ncbi:MAG: hypothetical protein FK733_04745 [Asgard group archaeon]|nr:hypothetical protein [Asgard group archaeon]
MNTLKGSIYRKGRKRKTARQMKLRDRFYKGSFYFFEVGFIIVAIPVLIVAILSIPVSLYFVIAGRFSYWPFVLVAVLITIFQIVGIRLFVKKYILDPHNLTFGEYLRMRYDERYNSNDDESVKEYKTWYDDLDVFTEKIKTSQREQTYQIYAQNYSVIPYQETYA